MCLCCVCVCVCCLRCVKCSHAKFCVVGTDADQMLVYIVALPFLVDSVFSIQNLRGLLRSLPLASS